MLDQAMTKVLVVTNMFPTQRTDISYYGIFVKEQMDALSFTANIKYKCITIDGFKNRIEYITSIPKILNEISIGNYDVIHIHYGLSGLFLLANPFKRWKNVILTFHGGDILIKQKKYLQVFLSRLIARKANRLIVLNDEMNLEVKKISSNVSIVPCGVDEHFFKGLKSPPLVCTLLFAGDPLRWVKNYPLFERIVHSYEQKYGAVIIKTLGNLDRTEVREILLSSTAIIMTSHSEGSPQIIKEALSCDIPIVSRNVGDVKKILGNTLGTRVFEINDTSELIAEKIDEAIKEAAQHEGARRARLLAEMLDNTSIAKRIHAEYLLLKI